MLPKLSENIKTDRPIMRKELDGTDVSRFGSFRFGDKIKFIIQTPRALGASGVVMRINRDGCADRDIPLEFDGENGNILTDCYSVLLDTKELCGNDTCGLFYYEFLFLRGFDTLFSDSINNVDFGLSGADGYRFRMLIYEKDFCAPESFGGGVMYHIFVDRFNHGCAETSLREDQYINPDWQGGVKQFASVPGGFVKNNEFFGGNLKGITEKLDYLASLGVSAIYLSPIFEAYSNHKYDTGDYNKIDSAFGSEGDLRELIDSAKARGMRIILDGVFNHTGDDSVYFNRRGTYDSIGAYNSENSAYRNWYVFKSWPDGYEKWWGVDILPRLNPHSEGCREFLAGPDGVAAKYIKMGVGGLRLDVADELSDEFLDELRENVKELSHGDAVIIGEVWENAADKVAYGNRRRYFSGRQLDSVMNYPLRQGIIGLVNYCDAEALYDILTELYSSYPRTAADSLMNLLGTHDTERILSLLGGEEGDGDRTNAELATSKLNEEQIKTAINKLKIASTVQFTAFGIPSVFYGDEVGLEGWRDPFCRQPFPWGGIDTGYRKEILEHYKRLGHIRQLPAFDRGEFEILSHTESSIVYRREKDGCRVTVAVNVGENNIEIECAGRTKDLMTDEFFNGNVSVTPKTVRVLLGI